MLCALVACVAVVAVMAMIARYVLRPLDRAARGRQAAAQFTLVDCLCLIFMAQLPTGLVRWMFSGTHLKGAWLVYGFSWIACGLLWWAGIRTLSRAAVRGTWQRAAFLALVLPTTVFGAMLLPVLTIGLLGGAFGEGPGRLGSLRLGLLLEVGFIIGLVVCGRYTRWMVARANGRGAQDSAKPEDPQAGDAPG